MINSNIEQNTSINYIDYDNLQPYDENSTHFTQLAQTLCYVNEKNNNWTDVFNAIIELRRLRKFQVNIFDQLFDYIVDEFLNFLNSKKICIIKLSLILVTEIFSNYSSNFIYQNWILKLVPKVLSKVIHENEIIKGEAIKALQFLINNMFYIETSKILLFEIANKNISISNIAYNALIGYLDNIDLTSLENIVDWTFFNQAIINLHSLKKDFYLKKAYKLFEYINQRFGNLNILTINMQEEQRQDMIKVFEQKTKIENDKLKTNENINRRKTAIQKFQEYQENKENKGFFNNVNVSL